VSTGEGSFKASGISGNWYASDFGVALAEVRPSGLPIYEYSVLTHDVPVLNMHNLPHAYLDDIATDRDLESGKFAKSQFIMDCLSRSNAASGASGVYFPSRRSDGSIVLLNPTAVGVQIAFTGQFIPTGLPTMSSMNLSSGL